VEATRLGARRVDAGAKPVKPSAARPVDRVLAVVNHGTGRRNPPVRSCSRDPVRLLSSPFHVSFALDCICAVCCIGRPAVISYLAVCQPCAPACPGPFNPATFACLCVH